MIDFLSTRASTDAQTRACARLLVAVIAMAIKDACSPMNKKEKRLSQNLKDEARGAISFLFGARSVFPLYASMIGSSAEAIRSVLIDGESLAPGGISCMDRRVLRARWRWYIKEQSCAGVGSCGQYGASF